MFKIKPVIAAIGEYIGKMMSAPFDAISWFIKTAPYSSLLATVGGTVGYCLLNGIPGSDFYTGLLTLLVSVAGGKLIFLHSVSVAKTDNAEHAKNENKISFTRGFHYCNKKALEALDNNDRYNTEIMLQSGLVNLNVFVSNKSKVRQTDLLTLERTHSGIITAIRNDEEKDRIIKLIEIYIGEADNLIEKM